jgi:hypothetical protein
MWSFYKPLKIKTSQLSAQLYWSLLSMVLLAGLAALPSVVTAQNETINPKINSPYSRFGLGDPVEQYFIAQRGMAGLSAAHRDPYHLNILNPASLAYLEATAFEVGLDAKYSSLEGDGESATFWSGNLTYLALGFPIINPINEVLDRKRSDIGLGMSFSLQPYTLVGYNVETFTELPEVGGVTNFLKGNGGTYRLNWGNGFSFKDLAVGVNLGYQFGKLTNSRRVEFDSLALSYTTEFLDETSINGFIWSIGAQYTYKFKKPDRQGVPKPTGKSLTIGAYGNNTTGFNTQSLRFIERFSSALNVQDTITYLTDIQQEGTMPSAFTIGITYEDRNKLKLGAELGIQNWSGYRNEALGDDNLDDTWRVSFGGEFIPNHLSYNNYFQKVRYRLGAFYAQDPRSFGGEQLTHLGLTFGMGFPIILPRQRTSFVNFAVEAGQIGLEEGLMENYIRMSLGFTLNDNTWFFKRKFN